MTHRIGKGLICLWSLVAVASLGASSVNREEPSRARSIREVLETISEIRIRSDLERLTAFGTRHTLSDTTSETRGIGAARRWLKGELERAAEESGGRMTVTFEEFEAPKSPRMPQGGRIANVVATLKGTAYPASTRRYYLVAHYDSRCADPMDAKSDAPGANDDGSGTVALLEIARAIAKEPLESTVVVLLTAGEEQSLVGSRYHADQAKARNEVIAGVLSNDIIGDPTPAPGTGRPDSPHLIRVFSEGLPRNPDAEEYARLRNLAAENDSPSRSVARYVADVARREKTAVQPRLVFRNDRFLRGGDHTPFLEAGFAAVRFTELDENYERQHADVKVVTREDGSTVKSGDLPEFVDSAYVANVARLNAAVILHLARSPAPPTNVRILTAELTKATPMKWSASNSADVAGYEVVWRDTTAPDWEYSRDVGTETTVNLPICKDDYFVGVRAYDHDGYKSPVVFAGAARD